MKDYFIEKMHDFASCSMLLTGFAVTAFVSIIIRVLYLLYLHPYAKYPGPKIAAISDAWWGYQWLSGRYPWAIEASFKKYGDVFRIAPNEIAIFPFEAHQDMLLSGRNGSATFIKTDIHPTFTPGELGVFAERDIEKHRSSKQVLSRAFSLAAHKNQDTALHSIVDGFIHQIEAKKLPEDDVNVTEWFGWLAADLIGEMSIGHSFENVSSGRANVFIRNFFVTAPLTNLLTVLTRFPCMGPLVRWNIPRKTLKPLVDVLDELKTGLKERVSQGSSVKHNDYFTPLLQQNKSVYSEDFLFSQLTAIVIPLEAVASLMQSIVTCLGLHQDILKKVQAEIRTNFATWEDLEEADVLQGLPWLSAVVNESLRFHTIATFPQPRVSPGGVIGGYYIPKGCRVQSSTFSMFRSERYFKKAREYHPERWLPPSHADYDNIFDNDNRAVFQPFSMGPRKCLGFVTADRQARAVISKLLWKFDWEIGNASDLDWERDMKVYQVTVRPTVLVKFKPCRHQD
ncbi:cytochrome P450 [Pseudovirgaria hyperparasitica]|uniref:Cytochrome P450 n=1 Tax=Pseudovirgaria hyperparasitica TaxID=470096 RepID=A0A6A6W675_9PEZI|nr:cytochrome P450 [Pseudovirgaria hyperparasitica]KAF2758045.1 cytochrome P450 [Pseudovirgaria hyperparasitica]